MRRSASQPSMPGIARSMKIASGAQARLQLGQRVLALGRQADREAQRLQPARQQLAVGLLVVDHQQLPARAGVAGDVGCQRPRRAADPLGAGRPGVQLGQEQAQPEGGAAADLALRR